MQGGHASLVQNGNQAIKVGDNQGTNPLFFIYSVTQCIVNIPNNSRLVQLPYHDSCICRVRSLTLQKFLQKIIVKKKMQASKFKPVTIIC